MNRRFPPLSSWLRAALLSLCLLLPALAAAQSDGLLAVGDAFKASARIAQPGVVALHWEIAPHYYLYRGRIKVKSAGQGVRLGALQLPTGLQEHDPYLGNVEIYHGRVDASLPYRIDGTTPSSLQLSVTYQGCHEVDPKICYPPVTQRFDLPLSVIGGIALPAGANAASSANNLNAALARIGATPPSAASHSASGTRASAAPPTASPLHASRPVALLLALVGGLILNLMPCVLPVLAIKAVGLLESSESKPRARKHALLYTAGVLCAFAAIGLGIVGLRTAGHTLGWGTQLQQPLLVGVLACVLFAVGLSMSGVVQFGAGLAGAGQSLTSRGGPAGDFFTGVLAVVVASPCTAPFMGGALAYAFAAPQGFALLIFLALGLGLALPFLLIGFVPALARLLPKPGRWMETLKQWLAFPMYLSAVWLVWVLANQRGADAVGLALVAMVLLAMTLWWYERSRTRNSIAHVLTVVLALATLAPLALLAHLPRPAAKAATQDSIVAYSPAKLAELRKSGVPVFVDITADWCVTCKANEYTVLDTRAFRALLARTGAVYMKGDWTDTDPTIGAFLQSYDSPGVPLYVVFPKDGGAGRKLPTVLTAGLVERALTNAAR